jgi:rhamnulokinase
VEILQDIASFPIKKLHVIGGGSQNRFLMQYAANALDMPVICGPVEGTALGNVLMQMKAGGMAGSLEEMRKISAASSDLRTYLPEDIEIWDKEYDRFKTIISKDLK